MKKKDGLTQGTKKNGKIWGIAAIAACILFLALVSWFIGKPMLALAADPEKFRDWVDSRGIFGSLIFIGMMIFQVIVAFIPGEPFEIGAGYAFGAVEGTVLCLLGTLLGSMLVFLLVRRFGVKLVTVFFSLEKVREIKFLKEKKKLNTIVFLTFLLPGTPKDLLTYAVGLTDMPLKTFLIITAVARIPSIITSTVGGSAIGRQDYLFAVIVFAVTLLLSGAGLLIYNKFFK